MIITKIKVQEYCTKSKGTRGIQTKAKTWTTRGRRPKQMK